MPQFRLPFIGYPIGVIPDQDLKDTTFDIPNGKTFMSEAFEVKGRKDKMFFIYSDRTLAAQIYIKPYRDAPQNQWLLYKTAMTVNPADPFMFFLDDPVPFVAIELSNSSGFTAKVKGWLFGQ